MNMPRIPCEGCKKIIPAGTRRVRIFSIPERHYHHMCWEQHTGAKHRHRYTGAEEILETGWDAKYGRFEKMQRRCECGDVCISTRYPDLLSGVFKIAKKGVEKK